MERKRTSSDDFVCLPLPNKYQNLKTIFQALELVLMWQHNLGQSSYFKNVKNQVERNINRTFRLEHLQQIVKVFPDAYNFSYVRDIWRSWLVIRINNIAPNVKIFREFDERRKQFRNLLTEIVKDHYLAFLQSLNPPVSIRREEIKCWDPRFHLNDIPDIQLADLITPEIPPSRFHLNQSSRSLVVKPRLNLPYHFSVLDALFDCGDYIINNQNTPFLTLRDLKKKMAKTSFDLKKFKQMVNVFPEAYEFHYDYDTRETKEMLSLVITPCFQASEIDNKVVTKMSTRILSERRNKFKSRLLDIVYNYHEVFLQSLNPPISIPREKITCWHRNFKLNKVPEICLAELPKLENVSLTKRNKGPAEIKQLGIQTDEKFVAALKIVKDQQVPPIASTSIAIKKEKDLRFKGIPQFLFDKIREKQIKKMTSTE